MTADPRRARAEVKAVHRSYVDVGCDVISTNTWGLADGAARMAARSSARARARPLDGRGAPGACSWLAELPPRRVGRRGGGRVQHQRRRRHARRPRDDPAAGASVRGRAARSDPARDAVARAQLDLRDRRGPARHRAPGVAELPALPSRRVRRLRRALGRTGGRRLRSRRAAVRGDGRRRAGDQLHPARPRHRHALLAARLHRPPARRVSEPRLPIVGRAGATRRASAGLATPSSR